MVDEGWGKTVARNLCRIPIGNRFFKEPCTLNSYMDFFVTFYYLKMLFHYRENLKVSSDLRMKVLYGSIQPKMVLLNGVFYPPPLTAV